MLTTNQAPCTHGIEVEQFEEDMPYGVTGSSGTLNNWHHDGSGPIETTIGPVKNAKSLLDTFYKGTRDEYGTWEWTAAQGTPGGTGLGAGSHVHLCLAEGVFEDDVTAWTIAYNTVVEILPFFAPFFCHNWELGFRNGVRHRYSTNRLAIEQWAQPELTRYSTRSIRDRVYGSRRRDGRTYHSVTFNGARGNKPVTIEIRQNDAHPGVALTGSLYLRRILARCIEAGWSPKLENRREVLQNCYNAIYNCHRNGQGLFEAMRSAPGEPIRFQEGRGIPGVEQLEFENMQEVLKACIRAYPQTPHSWSYRVERLVFQCNDSYSPSNNPQALWNLDAPRGEFSWEAGPEAQ